MSDIRNLIKIENQVADSTSTDTNIGSGIYIFSVSGFEDSNLVESMPLIELQISLDDGTTYHTIKSVDYAIATTDYFEDNIFIRHKAKIRIKSSLYDAFESGTGLNIRFDKDVISGHHINTYI